MTTGILHHLDDLAEAIRRLTSDLHLRPNAPTDLLGNVAHHLNLTRAAADAESVAQDRARLDADIAGFSEWLNARFDDARRHPLPQPRAGEVEARLVGAIESLIAHAGMCDGLPSDAYRIDGAYRAILLAVGDLDEADDSPDGVARVAMRRLLARSPAPHPQTAQDDGGDIGCPVPALHGRCLASIVSTLADRLGHPDLADLAAESVRPPATHPPT